MGREEGGRGRHCITIDTHTRTHLRDRMNRLLTHLERSEAMVAITQEEKEKLRDRVCHVAVLVR